MNSSPHHSLYETGGSYYNGIFDANTGVKWLPVYEFEEDESKSFTVVFNWNRQGVAKDWSLTAWGTEHSVTVTHDDELESDHMPKTTDENRPTPSEIIVP